MPCNNSVFQTSAIFILALAWISTSFQHTTWQDGILLRIWKAFIFPHKIDAGV